MNKKEKRTKVTKWSMVLEMERVFQKYKAKQERKSIIKNK